MLHHLILGCGFLGSRLATRLVTRGDRVTTTTRHPAKAESLNQAGIEALTGNFDESDLRRELVSNAYDSITICVTNDSPSASHQQVYLSAAQLGIDAVKKHGAQRIHFVSTTGVYAAPTRGLVVVDESWPTDPVRPGSIASLMCENLLRQELPGQHHVYRLAGIYHSDRMPNLAKLESGESLPGRGEGWLNLIHADDAAAILEYATRTPPAFDILNVSDGQPVTRQEFYNALAERRGFSPPTFDATLEGRGGQKIVDNTALASWFPGDLRDPLAG